MNKITNSDITESKPKSNLKPNLSNWRTEMKSELSPVKTMTDLVKYPVINEKSLIILSENRQYTFDVDLRLNKTQIRKLFENLFNVNVVAVNTHIPPRKKVRVGLTQGYRPQYKRVIITLKKDQSIDF